MLKAGCIDFPSDQLTCGAAWDLGEGKKVELIRFPALKWRMSQNEEAPDQRRLNDKKGDSASPGRAWAPVARWGESTQASEWVLLFLFFLTIGNI